MSDIQKQYEDGMPGYILDVRAKMEFLDSQPVQYFSEPNIKGVGKGKRALLWQYVRKLDPTAFTEVQTTGDCFVAGTLVRMGDGSERNIENVSSGDYVASPFGGVRKVLSVFSKPYDGDGVTLRAEGFADSITSTSDHLFVSYPNKWEWKWSRADELAVGDRLLSPRTRIFAGSPHVYDLANEVGCSEDPNEFAAVVSKPRRKVATKGKVRASGCRYECNRWITLDEDVAWLIGLWLAEGSADKSASGLPTRLRWNLCIDEMGLAERVCKILESNFGIKGRIGTIPSKPTCLFVNVCCPPLARWMYRECGAANTYGKRVPHGIFTSAASVRAACLQGWMAGDGCLQVGQKSSSSTHTLCKATGVSVSIGMVRDMKYLATSCGIRCSQTMRKSRGRSKVASNLHFYGESVQRLYEGVSRESGKQSQVWSLPLGFAPRIKEIAKHRLTGTVYCIEVDQDHAFVANGYAVHNCVSHGSRGARECTRAVEILVKREPEDWFKRGATEPTYGARGHGGQGMSPARASQFERDVGFLARTKYEGVVDLSKYDSSIGTRWGTTGVPENVRELCKKNKVGVITNVQTQDDLMDALLNGYAAHSGQLAAWSNTPNSKNIHPRTNPGWAHDMAIVGYDDTQEYWPFRVWFIQNSWGKWCAPVKDWPKDYPEQLPGMIVTNADDFNVCVGAGDCWVYGHVDGYPPQRLPDFGTIGMLHYGE